MFRLTASGGWGSTVTLSIDTTARTPCIRVDHAPALALVPEFQVPSGGVSEPQAGRTAVGDYVERCVAQHAAERLRSAASALCAVQGVTATPGFMRSCTCDWSCRTHGSLSPSDTQRPVACLSPSLPRARRQRC